MGNEVTTLAPPRVPEEIIKIVNTNVQQTAHLERSANATTKLVYIGTAVLVLVFLYVIYHIIIKLERLRTQEAIKRAVSLASVTAIK